MIFQRFNCCKLLRLNLISEKLEQLFLSENIVALLWPKIKNILNLKFEKKTIIWKNNNNEEIRRRIRLIWY